MDEATYQRLEAKIHAACLQAVRAMPDVKRLSWFGRNVRALDQAEGER